MTRLTPEQIGEIEAKAWAASVHLAATKTVTTSEQSVLDLLKDRAALLAHIRTLERAGWKMLPREPTQAMWDAWASADDLLIDQWQAMYDAAPPSPEPAPGQARAETEG